MISYEQEGNYQLFSKVFIRIVKSFSSKKEDEYMRIKRVFKIRKKNHMYLSHLHLINIKACFTSSKNIPFSYATKQPYLPKIAFQNRKQYSQSHLFNTLLLH